MFLENKFNIMSTDMPQSNTIDISVIVPVFNEEDNLPLIYDRLLALFKKMNVSYEICFVNDGSRDNSIGVIKDLFSEDPSVRYIDFSRNFGHQIAVSAGLDYVTGKSIVIIDADLQDPPELIEELYSKLKEGFEVVYAKRRYRKGETFIKKLTAKLFYRLLQRITPIEIPLDTGDYRIMDERVVAVLREMKEHHKFIRGQISWIGFNQTFVEYDRNERFSGQTGYSYSKMIRFAIDGITSFSDFPLKVASLLGFAVSIVSFLYAIIILSFKLLKPEYHVQGWTSLIICVLLLGGIQLISIGIIGEYMGRMNENVKNRPLYVIRDTNCNQ